MKKDCIDNKNFVQVVNKYREVIKDLEARVKREGEEKTRLARNLGDLESLTPRIADLEVEYRRFGYDYSEVEYQSSSDKVRHLLRGIQRELMEKTKENETLKKKVEFLKKEVMTKFIFKR